jgi:hypothetical protein
VAESVIKNLFLQKDLKVSEFQITRPDLQTIFLRATKQNWDEKDISNRTNVKN